MIEVSEEDDLSKLFGGATETTKASAYDGELNPMTFNHVKSSKAFDVKKNRGLFDISSLEDQDDEFSKWLENSRQQQASSKEFGNFNSSLLSKNGTASKHSEDGWHASHTRLGGKQGSVSFSGEQYRPDA